MPLYAEFLRHFAADHRRLFGYILAFLPRVSDAEEVFQEASLVLWREFHQFRPEADFLPWAKAVCFNQIRAYRRRNGRERGGLSNELLETLASEEAVRDPQEERREALKHCLQKLPERERFIVENFYDCRQNAQQIADALGCSVHTIYKTLQRVRVLLFECIDRRLEQGE